MSGPYRISEFGNTAAVDPVRDDAEISALTGTLHASPESSHQQEWMFSAPGQYAAGSTCASTGFAATAPFGANCAGGRKDYGAQNVTKLCSIARLGTDCSGGVTHVSNASILPDHFSIRNSLQRVGAMAIVGNGVCGDAACKESHETVDEWFDAMKTGLYDGVHLRSAGDRRQVGVMSSATQWDGVSFNNTQPATASSR